jgi:hypothetical protein
MANIYNLTFYIDTGAEELLAKEIENKIKSWPTYDNNDDIEVYRLDNDTVVLENTYIKETKLNHFIECVEKVIIDAHDAADIFMESSTFNGTYVFHSLEGRATGAGILFTNIVETRAFNPLLTKQNIAS